MEGEIIQPKATEQFRKHYLEKIFSRLNFPRKQRAFVISAGFYGVFLLTAVATDWKSVINSFLHLWQISFSITIFLGLWFGDIALKDVKIWLAYARNLIDESEFFILEHNTLKRLGSRWAILFALPFIIPGLYIALSIANKNPAELFPFGGYSPAFLYTVVIELCLIMLHLFGATGLWLFYVFTKSSQELQAVQSISDNLVDDDSLIPMSEIVLKLCSYLLLILGSAMPGIAYVGFRIEGASQWVVVIFAVTLPTIALIVSYWLPTFFLHKIILKTKERRLTKINQQISYCETMININLSNLSSKHSLENEKIISAITLLQFLYQNRRELKTQSTWPYKVFSLVKLFGSSFITVSAFFNEKIIEWLFASGVVGE